MGSLPRLVTGLLALALGTGAAPAARPPDPAAIAAANGHPALQHRRAAATVTRDGRTVALTIETDGMRRLERACIGPACSGNWFDGSAAWTFGPNATPVADDGADLALLRTYVAIASLAWAEPAFVAGGGSVRALDVRPEGARYEVRARGGEPLVAVIDPHSLAPRGIEPRPGALAIPADEQRIGAGGVVAAPLAPPPGAAPTLSGTGAVTLAGGDLPVVPCTLGGRVARCLIDTGTTPSEVTLGFAERLGLEPQGEIEIAGFSRGATGVIETGPLTIGPARWTSLYFAVAPLNADLGFDVVIGNDIVAATPLRLDRRARALHFGAPPGGVAIPLGFHDGLAYGTLGLRGRERPALLDTGDVATASIGYDDFRRELADLPVQSRVEARGIGGGSDAFFVAVGARAASLDLGSIALRVTRAQHGAHLGWGLAARCRDGIAFDEPARRAVCAGGAP